MEEDIHMKTRVSAEIQRQAELAGMVEEKIQLPKDVYETFFKIEKDILNFDRIYNRFEKFAGRKLFDPQNHERREQRMLQKKNEREKENYTFFFGGLTEEEQMYRDYFETDLEDYPENTFINEIKDNSILYNSKDYDLNKYQIVEENTINTERLPGDDFIEKLLFKYRYRTVNDKHYERRESRSFKQFLERAQDRDKNVIKDLGEKIEEIYVRKGLRQSYKEKEDEIIPHADYIVTEGLKQFKDYYQSDLESGEINADMLDDLNERDRLRFSECFVGNFTRATALDKGYVTIPKKPLNESKSLVHNFVEDLIDFNYRVKPLARHLAFKNSAAKFQNYPLSQDEHKILNEENQRYKSVLNFKKAGKTSLDQLKAMGEKI